jgi:uncharacterized phage-associated protein
MQKIEKPIKYTGNDTKEILEKLHKVSYSSTKDKDKDILNSILNSYNKYSSFTIKQVSLINEKYERIRPKDKMKVIKQEDYDYMISELDRMELEIERLTEILMENNIKENRL